MSELLQQLGKYQPFKAIVIGDFMLDEHVHGAAERLSPDAPVPVLHATRFEKRPGGAANVALCLQALKATVACFGIVGDDSAGRTLRNELEQHGCDAGGILIDNDRPTTVKQSLIGLAQHRHPQKMFRVDVESRDPLSDSLQADLLEKVNANLHEADVVCLEDYDKGVCTESFCQQIVALCREHNVPLLVDPASLDDYARYRGATGLTPNRTEAERATGLATPLQSSEAHNQKVAETLLHSLDLDAVVLTLDKSGALLARPNSASVTIPTVARTIYDVTGAGDMVLAALAGAVANKFDWPNAVRFANAAAGLEVEVFGVQPIPFAKVRRSILAISRDLQGKIRSLDDLLIELDVHRESGDRIVLTNGCFDVIHAGHVAYLSEARKLGDVLVVAVNADPAIEAMKGTGRPVFRESERLEILSAFGFIDYLVVFNEPTAHDIIKAIQPHIYVKGGDYRPQDVNEYDLLKPMMDDGTIEFRTIALRQGLSSTEIIRRFAEAYSVESMT